jgi:hypothetical protein
MSAPLVPAPEPERPPHGARDDGIGEGVDVGSFRQGSPFSQWALARYLVGRAVTESLGRALLVLGLVLLALSAGAWLGLHSVLLGIVVLVVAGAVLLFRAVLLAVVGRLTAVRSDPALAQRMQALVDDTRPDVLAELRRIGLPGRTATLPLLVLRFAGAERRRQTFEKLRGFDLTRVVPNARLDELHLLLRTATQSAAPSATSTPAPSWPPR